MQLAWQDLYLSKLIICEASSVSFAHDAQDSSLGWPNILTPYVVCWDLSSSSPLSSHLLIFLYCNTDLLTLQHSSNLTADGFGDVYFERSFPLPLQTSDKSHSRWGIWYTIGYIGLCIGWYIVWYIQVCIVWCIDKLWIKRPSFVLNANNVVYQLTQLLGA